MLKRDDRQPQSLTRHYEEMWNAIGDNQSDLASSEDQEDGEDEGDNEEDTGHGKLSNNDKPRRVMGTISKTVQHRMESIQQKQLRLNELMQPGWGDAADYFCDSDMKYGRTDLKASDVGTPQAASTAATPSITLFGELLQALDIVPG
jgi:hypothetical protein